MNKFITKSFCIVFLFLLIAQFGYSQYIYGLDILKADESVTIYNEPKVCVINPIRMPVFLLNDQGVFKRLKNMDNVLVVGEKEGLIYLNINDSIYEAYSGSMYLNRYHDLSKAMEYLDSIKCRQIFKGDNYARSRNGFIIEIKEVGSKKNHSLNGADSALMLGVANNEILYLYFKNILFESSIYNFSSTVLDSIIKKNDSELKLNIKASKEKRRSSLVLKYGNDMADVMLKGKVLIGMTREMAIESWGKPNDINTTTTQYGRREQWVYDNRCYLYFENGKLISVQN